MPDFLASVWLSKCLRNKAAKESLNCWNINKPDLEVSHSLQPQDKRKLMGEYWPNDHHMSSWKARNRSITIRVCVCACVHVYAQGIVAVLWLSTQVGGGLRRKFTLFRFGSFRLVRTRCPCSWFFSSLYHLPCSYFPYALSVNINQKLKTLKGIFFQKLRITIFSRRLY